MAGNKRRMLYNIAFTGDTTLLQASVLLAFDALKKISINTSLSTEMQKASLAALELSGHLNKAYNKDLGKLDLINFNNSLKQSNMTLQLYAKSIMAIGPAGELAFMNVAHAITSAELPLRRSSKLLNDLWITMKNTVRWLLTSSALHGFVGSLETAYGYSKNLDKSLNSIRIVTSKSADEMAKFAKEANNAAKALNTTTTKYTDASLIYYQQGLNDLQVKDRTNTTIDMANVSNLEAETVSELLTAIWNNFDDGSKTLRYYADVMVALGASTASSSDEIAEGILKFAAVADTVGLSYEYAAAALATLTANTRENADVVGNALKTLFARIQGLKLGETLDDGTDLNKYSTALKAIGVDIKDTTGELKNMDLILSETASKWETLSKDLLTALAQTVAGVRQYNLFIALMDNWGDFETNLNTAINSTGALTKLADIYAESWKAARDRVRASAEDIYDSLIDPEFYIGFNNGLAIVLERVADVVDSLGGMGGVLTAVSAIMFLVYGDKMAAGILKIVENIGLSVGYELMRARALLDSAKHIIEELSLEDESNELARRRNELKLDEINYLQELNKLLDGMSESERKATTPLQENVLLLKELYELARLIAAATERRANSISLDMYESAMFADSAVWLNRSAQDAKLFKQNLGDAYVKGNNYTDTISRSLDSLIGKFKEASAEQLKLHMLMDKWNDGTLKGSSAAVIKYAESLGITESKLTKVINAHSHDRGRALSALWTEAGENVNRYKLILVDVFEVAPNKVDSLAKSIRQLIRETLTATEAGDGFKLGMDRTLKSIALLDTTIRGLAGGIVKFGQVASLVSMLAFSMLNLVNVFSDDSLNDVERFTRILTSLGMILPGVISLTNLLGNTTLITNGALAIANKIMQLGVKATNSSYIAKLIYYKTLSKLAGAERVLTAELIAENAEILKGNVLLGAKIGLMLKVVAIAAVAAVAIYALVKAYNADADAAKEANKAATLLNETYELAKGAYDSLVASIEKYLKSLQALKELTVGSEEYADALKEVNKQALELVNTNIKLLAIASRNDLGLIVFDEDKLAAFLRQSQIDINNQAMANIIGLISAREADITSLRTNLKRRVTYTESTGLGDYRVNIDDAILDNVLQTLKDTNGILLDSDIDKIAKSNTELRTAIKSNIRGFENLYESMELVASLNEYLVDEISRHFLISSDSEFADRPESELAILSTISGDILLSEEFKARLEQLLNYYKDQIGGFDDATILTMYARYMGYSTSIIDNLKGNKANYYNEDGTVAASEVSDRVARNYIAYRKTLEEFFTNGENAIFSQASEGFDVLKDRAKDLEETLNIPGLELEILGFINKVDTKFNDLTTYSPEQVDAIRDALQDAFFGSDVLSQETWQTLGYKSGIAFIKEVKLALLDYDPIAYYEATFKKAANDAETVGLLIQTALSGEEWDDKLVELLDILEEKYSKLAVIRDRGSAQYIQALRDIREGEEQLASSSAIELMNAAWGEIPKHVKETESTIDDEMNYIDRVIKLHPIEDLEIEINSEKFTDLLRKFLDLDYKVLVAIEADIKSDIEDVNNFVNAFNEATSLIQEGFKVAYDDIETLLAVFPGILADYTVTADGMILLNADIAQSAVDLAKTQIENDLAAAKQNILDYQSVLLAKAAAMRLIAEGLHELNLRTLEGELDTSAEQAKILLGLTNFKSACADEEALISEGLAKSEINDTLLVIDANELAAGNSANNWANAYNSMANNSSEWAKIAIRNAAAVAKAMKEALTGGDPMAAWSDVARGAIYSKYSGGGELLEYSNIFESQGLSEANWEDFYQAGDFEAAYEAAIREAESYEAAAANLTVYLAKLDGAKNLINHVSNNLGRGTGGGKELNKELKELEDIEDRYHEINRLIERLNDLLEDTNELINRTYGTDRLDNYDKHIELLVQQLANYNEKLLQARDRLNDNYFDKDTGTLRKLFGDSILLDKNSEIINYNKLLAKAVEEYNQAVISATTQELIDSVKLLFDARIEGLKKYEDTIDEIRDLENLLQEIARNIEDDKLSKIEYRLEVILDVKSMQDSVRDLSKTIALAFGDVLTHGLEVVEIGKQLALIEKNMKDEYLKQYDDLKAMYENASSDADRKRIMEDIKNLQSNVISSAEAIVEWANSIEDIVPAAVSAAAERYSKFTNLLEHNNTVLDTIKELYALQGVTYKTMDGYNRLLKVAQEKLDVTIANSQLERRRFEEAQRLLAESQAALDSLNGDKNDVRYDTYLKARDAHLEQFNEAQEAYLASAKEAMEVTRLMYLDELEKSVYDFGLVLSKGLGLDLLQDKYDHFIDKDGRYLDKVNEAYETASWYNKLQADIDKATNDKAKELLKALLAEIDLRREGGKLSQYDLDILEAKYKVLQAQMALEDAQNAKNRLLLVRDRQGNWNYQYTADPNEVADAELDLLDALNEWYNIAKLQVEDVTGEIITTWQECSDKIKEIYSDMTLTDEERSERALEIYAYYSEKIQDLEREKNVSIEDMTLASGEALRDIADLTSADLTDIAGRTAEDIIKELDVMTTGTDTFEKNLSNTLDKANNDFLKYQDKVANVADLTGTSLDRLDSETQKVSDSTDRLRDAGIDASYALADMVAAAQDAAWAYADMAVEVWEAVRALLALAAEQASYAASKAPTSSSTKDDRFFKNIDYTAAIHYGIANGLMEYGDSTYNELINQRENKIDIMGLEKDYYGTRGEEADKLFASYLKGESSSFYLSPEEWRKKMLELGITSFATGGYTGSFENSRMAFLHEKELVLNLQDTENILSAVSAVRGLNDSIFASIEKTLDGDALTSLLLMALKLDAVDTAPVGTPLEQRVIFEEVNFPNVTDRNEIEEAFRNLVNDASQYATRRQG